VTIYLSHFYILMAVVAAALPVYWLLLRRDTHRRWFVVVVSLVVLALIQPAFAVVTVGLAYIAHQVVAAHKERRLTTSRALLLAIAVAVVTLAIGKYGQVMVGRLWGQNDWLWSHLVMPLGISYFVFRLLQYVFDHVRGVLESNSFRDLLAFLLFVPTFPAGPIETYQGFWGKRSLTFDRELFNRGIRRIILGYFKKRFVEDFIFYNYLRPYAASPLAAGWHFSAARPLQASVFVVYFFIRAYIDLSAYTDLAIGFSRLFGFRIMENFNNPLFKRNLSDFWRGWHISLSTWCRNNVYFPVFGATRKVWLGLYASMLTMGLWHYVSLNWTLWALWHGTGLVAVNWWMKRKKAFRKQHRGGPLWSRTSWRHALLSPLWYVLTFCYVALGYSFVGTPDSGKALRVFGAAVVGPFVWLSRHGASGWAAVLLVCALVVAATVVVKVVRRRLQPAT
jgi:alginate O-acetyltransferase complex protein AlgI